MLSMAGMPEGRQVEVHIHTFVESKKRLVICMSSTYKACSLASWSQDKQCEGTLHYDEKVAANKLAQEINFKISTAFFIKESMGKPPCSYSTSEQR